MRKLTYDEINGHDNYGELVKINAELLGACKLVLAHLTATGYGGANHGTENRHERMLAKLIAKAEGKS